MFSLIDVHFNKQNDTQVNAGIFIWLSVSTEGHEPTLPQERMHSCTHTHTHTHTYMCVCVCVCVYHRYLYVYLLPSVL